MRKRNTREMSGRGNMERGKKIMSDGNKILAEKNLFIMQGEISTSVFYIFKF